MRIAALSLAIFWSSTLAAAEPTLEDKSVLDGKVTVPIPKGFKVMSKELIKKKYPAGNAPKLIYTNERGTVNIAINHLENRVAPEQLPQALEATVQVFNRLHPQAQWFRKEMTKINDRDFFVLDLRTKAVDTDIRNIMCGTSLDGRMLMVTFNCTKELEGTWLEAGKKAIEGIKVK